MIDLEFPIGTVLRLIRSAHKERAKVGAKGIVVDGKKEFPNFYGDLLSNVSLQDLESFIGVVWDKKDPNYVDAEDGFYFKYRFVKHENQNNFLEEKKEIKNNDGRDSCFRCGGKTKIVPSLISVYTICPKCLI